MLDKDLFSALEREEPPITIGDLESYTVRKMRERKMQRRAVVVLGAVALMVTPFLLRDRSVEAPQEVAAVPEVTTALPPSPQVETHVQRVAFEQSAMVAPPRRFGSRATLHRATHVHDAKSLIISATLRELRSPDPPGSRESIASSFYSYTIQ
jgi:hypothetical protein